LPLPGRDAREQPHQRARVRTVDLAAAEAAQADAADDELVVAALVDLGAEHTHGADRRLGVAGAPEAPDVRLPLADRSEQDGTMGDRLVAGHGDVPVQLGGRLDPQPIARPISDASARISAAKSW